MSKELKNIDKIVAESTNQALIKELKDKSNAIKGRKVIQK